MEVKIDKRTREYKMQQVPGEVKIELPGDKPGQSGLCITTDPPTYIPDVVSSVIPVKPDYTKVENNPGFGLCTHCGGVLPPNEDGSPHRSHQGALCHGCTWRNNK